MEMARTSVVRWFWVGAMAFSLVSFFGLRSASAQRHEHEDFERTATVEELPREVRHAAEAEAHGNPILLIHHVRHGDHEFFRVTIDGKHDVDKVVRFGMDGRVLSVDEAVDTAFLPPRRYIKDEEITWSVEHPERIGCDRLPPIVRANLQREAEGAKLDLIVAYRDHGHVIFQANVTDPDDAHKVLVLQVGYDGKLYGDIEVGHGRIEQKEMSFRELPPAVRETIVKESEGHKFESITVESHRGHTFYVLDFPYRHGQRWLTVDNKGRIVADTVERPD